jgi:hypothetical protein
MVKTMNCRIPVGISTGARLLSIVTGTGTVPFLFLKIRCFWNTCTGTDTGNLFKGTLNTGIEFLIDRHLACSGAVRDDFYPFGLIKFILIRMLPFSSASQ